MSALLRNEGKDEKINFFCCNYEIIVFFFTKNNHFFHYFNKLKRQIKLINMCMYMCASFVDLLGDYKPIFLHSELKIIFGRLNN